MQRRVEFLLVPAGGVVRLKQAEGIEITHLLRLGRGAVRDAGELDGLGVVQLDQLLRRVVTPFFLSTSRMSCCSSTAVLASMP